MNSFFFFCAKKRLVEFYKSVKKMSISYIFIGFFTLFKIGRKYYSHLAINTVLISQFLVSQQSHPSITTQKGQNKNIFTNNGNRFSIFSLLTTNTYPSSSSYLYVSTKFIKREKAHAMRVVTIKCSFNLTTTSQQYSTQEISFRLKCYPTFCNDKTFC